MADVANPSMVTGTLLRIVVTRYFMQTKCMNDSGRTGDHCAKRRQRVASRFQPYQKSILAYFKVGSIPSFEFRIFIRISGYLQDGRNV